MAPGHLNPARLPPGTRVGPWRVLERRGWGAYGAVYRAVGVERAPGPVAIKLALQPGDKRFARERELLSRLRHPSVPRFVGHGTWRPPGGLLHPYLVMQWVEGVSLYEWAHVRQPSSRQVLRVLANVARALEATHAAGGVHRDVKGDNMLVRLADDHVFLIDFGSGHYVGAATLTSQPLPPGTPPYRSPEAWRSVRLPFTESDTPYAPGPADDVFALGVSAYRLVTGEYPFQQDPASGAWHQDDTAAPAARAFNPCCCEELSELTSQMLSVSPDARGSARDLAKALERAARRAGPAADVPLFAREESQPEETRDDPQHFVHRASGRASRPWLGAVSLGGAVALGAAWLLSAHPEEEAEQAQTSLTEEAKDGGTVAVGDTALTAPVPLTRAPSALSPISVDIPPKPLPGQARTDASGRCPGRALVPINGGCWMKLSVGLKDCDANFNFYVHKGECYGPYFPPARPPTSSPTERPDDTP